jgi:small-conductance mechanosensitive channel
MVAITMASVLIACGTTESTSVPSPTVSPRATTTYTPEPPTSTPEPDAGDEAVALILPSPTPAPTITPSVFGELISEYIETKGLQAKSFLGVRVDVWIDLAISTLWVVIIGLLLARLIYFGLTKAIRKTKNHYAETFLKQIRLQIFAFMLVVGFQVGTIRLSLIDALGKRWLNQLYLSISVVIVTEILWRLLDALVKWYQTEVEPKRDRHQVDTILILLHRGGRVLLVTTSGIMLLSLYNINVNALIAAQDTLSNVISGIMIMLDQPFRVGDRIEIQHLGTWGDVVDIGLRSTRIRTRDNRLVIVPNNIISTDQVVNYTYPDPRYRIQIELGIGYGQDIEQVRQILVDTVRQVEGVLLEKPVDALYVYMAESAMIFRVRWWIHSYVDTRRMFDRVNTALQVALDQAGIKTPFNTLDINILNMPGVKKEISQSDDNEES